MYETFYGFRRRPFLATPTLDRYFPADEIEKAFQTVAQAIERGDGPVAIMGSSGVGKSMLALRIADSWRRNYEVVLLSSSKFCTRRALLQSLLFELRMPYRQLSEGELRLSLQDRLQWSIDNPSDGLLLIVDEAQSLHLKLLEELRILTNLSREGVPRVRLVLIGTPRLDELLAHPKMESLNQRLSARCYLHALTADEVHRYVRHKIELCGVVANSVMTDDAIRTVHRASGGIPRLIDQIADHSFRLGATEGLQPIGASIVEQAWASIQQLPSPWTEATSQSHSSSVEYGPLDWDEDSDAVEFESDELSQSKDTTATTDGLSFEPDVDCGESVASPSQMAEFDSVSTLPSDFCEESFFGSMMVGTNEFAIDALSSIDDEGSRALIEPSVSLECGEGMDVGCLSCESIQATDPFGDDFDEVFEVPKSAQPVERLDEEELGHRLDLVFEKPHAAIPFESMDESIQLDEKMIESEIREMISSLQLSSKVESSPSNTDASNDSQSRLADEVEIVVGADATHSPHILSFASLGSGVKMAFGDDRDLLVIEETVDPLFENCTKSTAIQADLPNQVAQASYVQLFSKLRG